MGQPQTGTGGLSHAVGTPQAGMIDEIFDAKLLAMLCENTFALGDITDAQMDAAEMAPTRFAIGSRPRARFWARQAR